MTNFHPIVVRTHIQQTTMHATRNRRWLKRKKREMLNDTLKSWGWELASLMGLVCIFLIYYFVAMWLISPVAK